jgi:hypothetical protein
LRFFNYSISSRPVDHIFVSEISSPSSTSVLSTAHSHLRFQDSSGTSVLSTTCLHFRGNDKVDISVALLLSKIITGLALELRAHGTVHSYDLSRQAPGMWRFFYSVMEKSPSHGQWSTSSDTLVLPDKKSVSGGKTGKMGEKRHYCFASGGP